MLIASCFRGYLTRTSDRQGSNTSPMGALGSLGDLGLLMASLPNTLHLWWLAHQQVPLSLVHWERYSKAHSRIRGFLSNSSPKRRQPIFSERNHVREVVDWLKSPLISINSPKILLIGSPCVIYIYNIYII